MRIVWESMSREFTRAREQLQKQYDFAPKGATVDIREPLKRSTSAQDVRSSTSPKNT
jgi:hypothetical protein